MQLLEIISKLAVAMIFCVSSRAALAGTSCSSNALTNPDIINCSQAAFVKIDKLLNEQYKSLMLEFDAPFKADLLAAQKSWIKLKGSYCEDQSDGELGAESPIEKLSCNMQFTSFRLNEIIYLRTGVIGDGFYKAVSVVNKKATAMDYVKAVKYVAGDTDFGPIWKSYAEQNCVLAHKLYGEVEGRCMARMQFQMPIF